MLGKLHYGKVSKSPLHFLNLIFMSGWGLYCHLLSISFRYRLIKEIGDGTCGNVYKALNRENSEIVSAELSIRWRHLLSNTQLTSYLLFSVVFFPILHGIYESAVGNGKSTKMKLFYYYWPRVHSYESITKKKSLHLMNLLSDRPNWGMCLACVLKHDEWIGMQN